MRECWQNMLSPNTPSKTRIRVWIANKMPAKTFQNLDNQKGLTSASAFSASFGANFWDHRVPLFLLMLLSYHPWVGVSYFVYQSKPILRKGAETHLIFDILRKTRFTSLWEIHIYTWLAKRWARNFNTDWIFIMYQHDCGGTREKTVRQSPAFRKLSALWKVNIKPGMSDGELLQQKHKALVLCQ